jgi:hypothetical protein
MEEIRWLSIEEIGRLCMEEIRHETTYFLHENEFSEDMEVEEDPITREAVFHIPRTKNYYPKGLSRPKPNWFYGLIHIDETLSSILDEVYAALENELLTLSAIGLRTVIENVYIKLIKNGHKRTFEDKVQHLQEKGFFSQNDTKMFGVLINVGNAAAHRGWKPADRTQLYILLGALEDFINKTFFYDSEIYRLGKKVPKKKKARKALTRLKSREQKTP